jgi:hypothetical protein
VPLKTTLVIKDILVGLKDCAEYRKYNRERLNKKEYNSIVSGEIRLIKQGISLLNAEKKENPEEM